MKKMFNQIRLKSGFHKLKQEIKKLSRKNHSVSWSHAKNIGILLIIHNQKELLEVEKLAEDLRNENKNVKLLVYRTDQNLANPQNANIQILSDEDIEWNYIPKKEKIISFVNHEFDMLINLCTEICFPLIYITALSKSLFKVGAYNKNQTAIFDFMIATEQHSLSGFSSELKHYLNKIK
jgi:UDP-N-acetylglucosamine pyrophosphorylase